MNNKKSDFHLSWEIIGGICGILSIVSYLAAAFIPMPDTLIYTAAFAFGPLLSIGLIGLYYSLSAKSPSPLTQIAAIFGIAGGFTVLIMLTVQQAIISQLNKLIENAGSIEAEEVYKKISVSLNSVHLGIDIAWDVLISIAVVLFGIAMIKHEKFGKIMGISGIILGSLLISFNIWYFPTPPVSSNSIDWGPFVALWLLVVFILLLRKPKSTKPI